MPIDFPSSPSSGQRYDYLSKSWIWNDVYWASIGASGNISSGQLGTPVVFSGNIASGSIGSFHFASGVGGGGGGGAIVLTSGSVTSGLIGNNAVTSGNIGGGQVGRFQINDFNPGTSLFVTRFGLKGYFAGGANPTITATADKLTYSTDTTAAQTTANLSQARSSLAGVSEKLTKGYFAGGTTNASVATADKLTYSTDTTVVQASANLSQARDQLAGCSGDLTKGYFAGGNTGSRVTTADKVTYLTDTTAAQTTANLSQARQGLAGISDGSTKGYFAGGLNSSGNSVTTADKLTFSNDTTAAQTTANLSQARYGLAGCNGNSTGYFAGGTTNSINLLSTAYKLTYSTDTTTAQTSANLSQARFDLDSVSEGSTKGYFAGGGTGTGLVVATTDKLTYSNDTTAAQTTANLSQAKYRSTGLSQEFALVFGNNSITSGNISSGQIGQFHFSSGVIRTATNTVALAGGTKGFFAGGVSGFPYTLLSTADKLTYSTNTTSAQASANLTLARTTLAGCSGNSTRGYFAGGDTNSLNFTSIANKLTYSTEATIAQASANLSQARGSLASVSEGSTKGYFAGGYTGISAIVVATTDKLVYSSDTTAAQTTANLSTATAQHAGCSGEGTKGYFAGGNNGGSPVVTAYKLIYSTDTTTTQTTANISVSRYGLAGISQGLTKGYFAGGFGDAYYSTADKLIYSTDTTSAQTTANLSQARLLLAGVSEGSTKGYFAGGSAGPVATADMLIYTTDTTVAQTSANLSQARDSLGGAGQESFDYPTVNSGSFGNSSVNSGNIASGIISRFHLSDASVYANAVLSGNVSTFKFANNAVFSGNISSSTISTTSLASGGFQSGAFGDNAISSGDILSGRIVASHIGSGEINSSHIVSGAIFNYHIGSVGAYNLSNNLILSGNIASGTITTFQFENGAILSGNIASGVIGNTHFGNASVTSGAIPSGTVIFNMVGALAAAPYNFADVALSSGNFALQSVTGENLADGVWQQPTAFYVSGGITAFMFNNNAIVSGSISTTTTLISQGYFAGGSTGANVSTTDKVLYSTDTTASQASANLSQPRNELAGISDYTTNGYFAGGATSSFSGHVATTDKIVYSTDTTAAQTTANLSQARQGLAGCSGERTKGYFAGGTTDQVNSLNTADKLTYSTGITAAQASANLSQARYYLAGISEGTTKGYFAGGIGAGGTIVATADKLTFSNDTTAAQTTADLSQAIAYIAGCSGEGTKGYFAGGLDNSFSSVATAYKITYTTDATAAQTTANLSQARSKLAGISEGSTEGYFAGGSTGANVATSDKITFSTDTTAAQTTANLSQARVNLTGIDGAQNYLYVPYLIISGKLTTTDANKIRSTNFASGSILSGNIASGQIGSVHISDNAIISGNIASGQVSISVHLANATILSGNIGSGVINFPTFFGDKTQYVNIGSGQIGNVHIGEVASVVAAAGYFAGGQNNVSPFLTTADKLGYSTGITVAQTTANLSQARHSLAGISERLTKGYFAGGTENVNVTTADKITYSTDTTAAQTTANLSQARQQLAGISMTGSKGYFAGGNTGAFVATADKLTYLTDTTVAQTTANLSQARTGLAGCSGDSTKGYFAGGYSAFNYSITADKVTYSTDTTATQTTANISQARYYLTGISDGSTKGYFAGGYTDFNRVVTADKLTYSTDSTAAQTTANLSQGRQGTGGLSGDAANGYFAGGNTGAYVATADKLTYSTDTTAAQTTANLSQARYALAGVDGIISNIITYSQFMTSSQISSGTILISGNIASGQNAAFPYNLAETAQINTNQPLFDYFVFQEQCSGIKAVCITSGSRISRAQRASGLRLPAIGVTSGTVNSGALGRVYYYGGVGRTGTLTQNSGLNNGISGFQGRPLYVGSGGNIVNLSGFWVSGVQQPPFISGDMQQQIGIAMSGGMFVMPSPIIVRSGFQGILPYNHPA